MNNIIIIKGIEVSFTSGLSKSIVDTKTLLSLADDSDALVVKRDMTAGSRVINQVNNLLKSGMVLENIRSAHLSGINRNTINWYLAVLRDIHFRRECYTNTARIIRKVRDLGCMSLLSIL